LAVKVEYLRASERADILPSKSEGSSPVRRVFRIPFSRTGIEREIDDEIAFHVHTRVDRLVAQGLTRDEALRRAWQQFGDTRSVRGEMLRIDRQRHHAIRRATAFSDIRQDLAFAARTLRRNVGFTALIIGGLALGIGANAAIYSVIDALMIRKLPVPESDRLVLVGDQESVTSSGRGAPMTRLFSYPLYRDIRDNNRVFDGLLATGPAGRLDVRPNDAATEPEHPRGRFVSGNYFRVLGVRAMTGTTLDPSDDEPGAGLRITISHAYWTRRFQRDPDIVGRTIRVDGLPATITGVAEPAFTGEVVGLPTDVWVPIASHDLLRPNDSMLKTRRANWLLLIGRAKPGITLEQARQQLIPLIRNSINVNATARELEVLGRRGLQYYVSSAARGASLARTSFRAPLVALMVGVGFLLCIVCVNVANLLLARGVARRREMLLRLAIGADRRRIIRQLLSESLLLASLSGAAAVIGGWWASRALLAMASEGVPVSLSVGPNPSVLAFTLLLSVASVLVFGLVPALRSSRVDLATALRAHSHSVTGAARFGVALIAGQVALSFVLLAGAVMLARSLRALESVNLGLDRDHVVVVDLDIGRPRYNGARFTSVVRALRDRVTGVPGVLGASYSNNGLFSGTEWSTEVQIPGFVARQPDDSVVAADWIGAGYARTLGLRLLAGRDFEPADETATAPTMLVNESFARFYFPGQNAVGRFVGLDGEHVEIVGVVGDNRGASLQTPRAHYARRTYRAYLQGIPRDSVVNVSDLRLLVRTAGDPASMVGAIRRAAASVDASLPIDGVAPLTELVRASIREERLVTHIATALGCLALVLAAIGLYGVMSYAIARRTNEIGVRIALGASGRQIARSVLRGSLVPVVIGLMVGGPLAVAAIRLLRDHLAIIAEMAVPDAGSVAVGASVLLASAIVAAMVPTRRAMRIDPLLALREE
jgi:predicted permease